MSPVLVERPNGCRSCGYPCEIPRPEHGLCTQCAEWAEKNMGAIMALPSTLKRAPDDKKGRP